MPVDYTLTLNKARDNLVEIRRNLVRKMAEPSTDLAEQAKMFVEVQTAIRTVEDVIEIEKSEMSRQP
jgi:hypothetical protein